MLESLFVLIAVCPATSTMKVISTQLLLPVVYETEDIFHYHKIYIVQESIVLFSLQLHKFPSVVRLGHHWLAQMEQPLSLRQLYLTIPCCSMCLCHAYTLLWAPSRQSFIFGIVKLKDGENLFHYTIPKDPSKKQMTLM